MCGCSMFGSNPTTTSPYGRETCTAMRSTHRDTRESDTMPERSGDRGLISTTYRHGPTAQRLRADASASASNALPPSEPSAAATPCAYTRSWRPASNETHFRPLGHRRRQPRSPRLPTPPVSTPTDTRRCRHSFPAPSSLSRAHANSRTPPPKHSWSSTFAAQSTRDLR
jgi:hypothetical protein